MRSVIILFVFFLVACSTKRDEGYKLKIQNPDFLHRSIKAVTDRIVHDIFSPPVASRIYAYTSIAAYESLVPGNKSFISLSNQVAGLDSIPRPNPGKEYSFEIASVEASLMVGKTLIFSEKELQEFHDALFEEIEATGIPTDILERSKEYGQSVGQAILEWAAKDNYKQSRSFPKYTIQEDPGTWRPTPPAYMDGIEPHWNKIRTFVIDSAQMFKPLEPTKFSTDKMSDFYKEAFEVYDVGIKLSDEQREIASFWDCNPYVMHVQGHVMFATKKITPGGHWINITRVACKIAKASTIESAEAYAKVSIALADAFISCWDEKYRSNLIRPETYINQYIAEDWTPLLQTPPFPEYTSGHSVISSAAAVTLTNIFGGNFEFQDSTEVEFGLTARSYPSFIKASEEAAISRLYGGIHYRPAIDNGITEGKALGYYISEKLRTRKERVAENSN